MVSGKEQLTLGPFSARELYTTHLSKTPDIQCHTFKSRINFPSLENIKIDILTPTCDISYQRILFVIQTERRYKVLTR